MRRRRAANSSMSLFPFLDTLVCTMGALILMLLAMTPKIKERALARQAAMEETVVEPAAVPEPEPVLIATEEDPAERHERQRRAWLDDLEESRELLRDRQAEYRRQRQQLKDLEQQFRGLQDELLKTRLKSETAEQASAALDERVQKLEAQSAVVAQKIAATRKSIDLAGRRQATAKNEFALVAYDGVSGTTRRPIYIECTGQGFRFLPEGEMVAATDLEGFSQGFNPLLAGTQRLVQFWARRRQEGGKQEPEPYVLLLVRPSGCFTFYIARTYLSGLKTPWGYELIEEDWKLRVTEPDPIAKSLLQETLAATMQVRRPNRVIAEDDRASRATFDPQELFESDASGDRPVSAARDGRLGPGTGGGAGGLASTRNGRAGSRGGAGPLTEGTSPRDGQFPRGTGGSGDPTLADNGPRRLGSGSARSAGIGGGNDPGARGGAATNRSGGRGALGSASGGSDVGSDPDLGSAIRDPGDSALADAGNPAAVGSGGRGTGIRGSGGSGSGRGARPATLGGTSDLPDGPSGGGGTGGDSTQTADFITDDDLLMSSAGGSSSGGTSGAGAAVPRGTAGTQESGAAEAGNPGDATADGQAGARSTGGAGTSGAPGRPAWLTDPGDEGSSSSSPMGGPGVNVSLGRRNRNSVDRSNPDDGPRIPEESDGRRSDGAGVRATGPRKWGQVGRRAGIGFEKKIKIYLNDKRIVVDNKQHMLLVSPSDSSEEIVNFVVSSMDAVADSWGEPPSNFYWVPIVQFLVYPGGDTAYTKLHTTLQQKWGVSSTVEYVTERQPKKPAKDKAGAGDRP